MNGNRRFPGFGQQNFPSCPFESDLYDLPDYGFVVHHQNKSPPLSGNGFPCFGRAATGKQTRSVAFPGALLTRTSLCVPERFPLPRPDPVRAPETLS